MSDSTTYPAKEDQPGNVQITFRDDVTQPELRQTVERSVATHVARFAEADKRAVAAQATRAKLQAAVNAPLMRLIEEDPAAVEALHELRNQQPLDPDSVSLPRDDRPIPDIRDAMAPALEDARGARDLRVLSVPPPYDFDFSWVDPDGSQPFTRLLNKEDGSVSLDARAGGGIIGGKPDFVRAYAGFGLILTTDRKVNATCYASRRMEYWGHRVVVRPGDIQADTTARTALTAFVDGTEIQRAGKNLISFGSSAPSSSGGSPGYVDITEPRSLSFLMVTGHTYTFEVSISVYSRVWPDDSRTAFARTLFSGWVTAIAMVRNVVRWTDAPHRCHAGGQRCLRSHSRELVTT